MLSKLICRILGHEAPPGVVFKETTPTESYGGGGSIANRTWECPRCGVQTEALVVRFDKPTRVGSARRIERP